MRHDRDTARSDLVEHGARARVELQVGIEVGDRAESGLALQRMQADRRRRRPEVLDGAPRRLDGGKLMVVGLELEVPGMDESIWASARVCYRKDDHLASGLGMRFVAMARSHARLLREFCVEMRRKNLGTLLARIRA